MRWSYARRSERTSPCHTSWSSGSFSAASCRDHLEASGLAAQRKAVNVPLFVGRHRTLAPVKVRVTSRYASCAMIRPLPNSMLKRPSCTSGRAALGFVMRPNTTYAWRRSTAFTRAVDTLLCSSVR